MASWADDFITFVVYGVPRPQGSKRHVGNGIMVESSKHVKAWREDVSSAARKAYAGGLIDGPVSLHVTFGFPRPRSHYRTGKHAQELKESAPKFHRGRPDLSKLIRAVEDALTGVVWRDDSQVVDIKSTKGYGEPAHCWIGVERVG